MNDGVEILIAEDSRTQAEQLRYLLEEHGYGVQVAGNGREALAAARERRPTLVISDIVMPEMDGYGLCRAIKEDEALREVPVILLTSLSDSEDVVRALEARADCYCTKPYDEEHLLSRIDFHLANPVAPEGEEGLEITVAGERHVIAADRWEILCLLLSTYESAVRQNRRLVETQAELNILNERLEERIEERTRELKKTFLQLKRQVREQEGLDRLTRFQMSVHNLEESHAEILEVLKEMLEVQQAVIYRLNGEGMLEPTAAMGLSAPGRLESDEALASLPAKGVYEKTGLVVRTFRERKLQQGAKGQVGIPILYDEELLGVLLVQCPQVEEEEGIFNNLCRLGGEAARIMLDAMITDGLEGEIESFKELEELK